MATPHPVSRAAQRAVIASFIFILKIISIVLAPARKPLLFYLNFIHRKYHQKVIRLFFSKTTARRNNGTI